MSQMTDKIVVIDADGIFWIHYCPSAAQIQPQQLEMFPGPVLSRFLPYGTKHTILTPNEIELYRLIKRFVKPDVEVGDISKMSYKLHQYMNEKHPELPVQILQKSEALAVCPELTMLYSLVGQIGSITVLSKGLVDIVIAGEQVGLVNTESSLKRCGGQGDILAGLVSLYAGWDLESVEGSHQNYYPLRGLMLASIITRESSKRAFEIFGYSTTSKRILEQIHLVLKDVTN